MTKKRKGRGGVGKEKTAAKKWCWLQLCVVTIQKKREREKGYGPEIARVAFAFSETSPPADSY